MRQRRVYTDSVQSSGPKSRSRSRKSVHKIIGENGDVKSSQGVTSVTPTVDNPPSLDVTDAATAALNVTNNLENRSPRTDYTYSSSLSYRALSPHKRVGSPNMARRPLHGPVPSVQDDSSRGEGVLSSDSSALHQYHDSRSSRRATLEHTDSEGEDSWGASHAKSPPLTSMKLVGSSATTTTTTTTASASTTRTVNFGLDYESDGEDFSPARGSQKRKHLSHRATPLLASSNLTSSRANHVPSLLSSPNGGPLYATEEQKLLQNRALHGFIGGLSYTLNQLARIPIALKHTIVSLTSNSSVRHNDDANTPYTKPITYDTHNEWVQSENVSNTSNAVGQKKSPMVLRSRRRVLGPDDSSGRKEEVEFYKMTQAREYTSDNEDYRRDTEDPRASSFDRVYNFFYTLLAVVVWATSVTASSVYCASKKTVSLTSSAVATATARGRNFLSSSYDRVTEGAKENAVQDGAREEIEDMDDPASHSFSWIGWFTEALSVIGGKRKLRKLNRQRWEEHVMDTRSKARRSDGAALSVDDITEHDYGSEDDHEYKQSATITSVLTTVITTIVETVYDLGFEAEEIGRKIIGASSRRQERDLQKRLRLAGYTTKSAYYTYSTDAALAAEVGGDDGTGVVWCCWLLPLLLCGCVALAGLTYWYGSEELYTAVDSSTTYLTSTASSVTAIIWESLRGATFTLGSWTKFIFWQFSRPFVYLYDQALLWSFSQGTTSSGSSVFDSFWSVGRTGIFGVVSVVQSAFTSVLSFCSWVFSGIIALLLYLWELLLGICSLTASAVYSLSLTASDSASSGTSTILEKLWSGLLFLWTGLATATGALVTFATTCVNATVGVIHSSRVAVTPAATVPEIPVVLQSSNAVGQSVDDLVARVLQSESLHQQLGLKVSSEVAAQTAPTAAQLQELQLSNAAAQTRTQQMLEQLQVYHDSLKQQLLLLNETLVGVESQGNEGRASLSATVMELQMERQQQMKVLQDTLRAMNQQIFNIQEEQASLSAELKTCCQRTVLTLEDVERHVNGLISALIGGSGGDGTASPADLKAWIGTYFVAKDQMEAQMADMMRQLRLHAEKVDSQAAPGPLEEAALAQTQQLVMERVTEALEERLSARLQQQVTAGVSGQTAALNDTIKAFIADAVALQMETRDNATATGSSAALSMAAKIALGGLGVDDGEGGEGGAQLSLSRQEVELIVKDALKKYDADRTGLVDHALESGGGSIVSTRCTEAYEVNQAEVSILGIPLYRYTTNTPRSIIQPDRYPGQCWAFKGSQGYVVIRLVTSVRPTGFSLEHIPKAIAPFGVIDSAPKNFSMWGLATENDEGVLLGSYQYREDGEHLQYFTVEKVPEDYFPFIELKIDSNHGNMKYTCVYRVRVHGIRMQ